MKDQYDGQWCVINAKSWIVPEFGYCLSPINGTYIFLVYKKNYFTVFQSFDEKLSQKKNYLSPEKPTNKSEDEKERGSLKAAQKNLGINVKHEKAEMPMKMQSFVLDAKYYC